MQILPESPPSSRGTIRHRAPRVLTADQRVGLRIALGYAILGSTGVVFSSTRLQGDLAETALWHLWWVTVEGLGFVLASAGLLYLVVVTAGARIRRDHRLSRVLLRMNETIARTQETPQLAQEVCQILVEYGGITAAWMELVDSESATLRSIAHARAIDSRRTLLDQGSSARPMNDIALHGVPTLRPDVARTDSPASWHAPQASHEFHASAGFPLVYAEQEIGVLNLSVDAPHALHDDETRVFQGLADTLARMIAADQHKHARERAEAALRQHEMHDQLRMDRLPDILFRCTLHPDLQFEYVSPAVLDILGYTPAEHYADPQLLLTYIHPDDRASLESSLAQLTSPAPIVVRCLHRHGETVWLECRTISIERDRDGTPVVLEGIARDVTTREQAAPQLQLQRAALEATATAIVITARDGRIEWVNPAFTTLTGYSAAEAIGQNPRMLRTDHQDQPFYESLWATILQGQVWHGTLTNRRKDGSEYVEEQTITPVLVHGEVMHFIGIKQDVTARVATDRQYQALATIAQTLRAAHTRAEILPLLLEQIMQVLPAQGAAAAIRDLSTGETVMELGAGSWKELTGMRIPAGTGISGQVIATGEPYMSNQLDRDPTFRPLLAQIGRMSAALCVPLYAYETVIGALWVARASAFTTSDLQTLLSIASLAASALHAAALFDLNEQRLRRLAGLHAIDTAINGSLDTRVVISTLLDQTQLLLAVDAVDILLLDPWQQLLTFVDGRGFHNRGFALVQVRLDRGITGQVVREQRIVHLVDLADQESLFARHALIAAEEFVSYFGVPLIAKGQVKGVMEVFHRAPLMPDHDWLAFLETLASQAAIAIDNTELFRRQQQANTNLSLAYDATIEGWSAALDLRDKETEGHTLRVTEMTLRLARRLESTDEALLHIRRGALLHDIGKMGVPDQILLKPGPLTDEEWVIMRKHPVYAYQLLAPIEFLKPALDIPYCHHEKWDGTGYPRGLKGREIPLAARLFALVDVWDALISDRPYRAGWPISRVLQHLRDGAGSHFDPQITPIFLDLLMTLGDA